MKIISMEKRLRVLYFFFLFMEGLSDLEQWMVFYVFRHLGFQPSLAIIVASYIVADFV